MLDLDVAASADVGEAVHGAGLDQSLAVGHDEAVRLFLGDFVTFDELGDGVAESFGDAFLSEDVAVEGEGVHGREDVVGAVFSEDVDQGFDLFVADDGGFGLVLDDEGDAFAGAIADDHRAFGRYAETGVVGRELGEGVFGDSLAGQTFGGLGRVHNGVVRQNVVDVPFERGGLLVGGAVEAPHRLLPLAGASGGCCCLGLREQVRYGRGFRSLCHCLGPPIGVIGQPNLGWCQVPRFITDL